MRLLFLIAFLITVVICPTDSTAQDTPKPQPLSVRQVTTASQPKTVVLNGADIILPTLPGFVEVSDLLPNVRNEVEASISKDNKLLAIYLLAQGLPASKDDSHFPNFDRYVVVQSSNAAPGVVSGHMLDELKTVIKTKLDTAMRDALPVIAKQTDKGAEYITTYYDVPIHLNIGEIKQLGSFHEDLNTLSSLMLANTTVTGDSSLRANVTVAVAFSFSRINNRLVYVYAYKRYENATDIDWVKNISISYTNQLQNQNPPNSPDPDIYPSPNLH